MTSRSESGSLAPRKGQELSAKAGHLERARERASSVVVVVVKLGLRWLLEPV